MNRPPARAPILLALACLCGASTSFAQQVVNPRAVEFSASADHHARLPNGDAAVAYYLLELYLAGAAQPFQTINIGKPAPQPGGVIRYEFASQMSGRPLPGGIYESAVAAVGPAGVGRSERSNQFTFDSAGTCAFSIAPRTLVVQSPPAEVQHGLRGEYFDRDDFTAPVATRLDATVDFAWGMGAPMSAMAADTFSVRWTGSIVAPATETFTFHTVSDDGVRLWVDDQLVIDHWTDHSPTEHSGSITLTAGERYDIRLEFYENAGDAVARLLWSSWSTPKAIVPTSALYASAASGTTGTAGGTGSGLLGEYFDSGDFTVPVGARLDAVVDFDWGYGAPMSGMAADTFSVRWTGSIEAPASETFTFHTVSDDGVRLWVDGQLVIDNWTDHAPTENSGAIALLAGRRYDIRLEFYENAGGAVARLLWSSPSTPKAVVPPSRLYPVGGSGTSLPGGPGAPGDGLLGEYFDSGTFTAAVAARVDAGVDFDWGYSAPMSAMGADTFSVRWTGAIEAPATETFTFSTLSDDGVRLWIDEQLVIDNWTDHAPREDRGSITLTAGERYAIRLEYYENGGGAVARLAWSSGSTPKAVVPPSRLYSLTKAVAAGESAAVVVTAAPGCAWAAASGASWIRVSPGAGSGPGVVRVVVDPNPGPGARTGTVSIAGQAVTVVQGR